MSLKKSNVLVFILLMIFPLLACKTFKMTPLLKAADQGQINEVNRLLAQGIVPDDASKQGVTPLFIAAFKGHQDIVRRLIDKNADVNAAVKMAFPYDDQTVYEGRTPLMAALSQKHADIAKILIKNGADVNARDINGATPLFIAAALNDESIVQYLIEKGADVDAAIENDYEYNGQPIYKGATSLMAALKMAQNANAALLVNSGADVNARCEDGTDALMIAALNGDAKMANFLLTHGATHQTRTRKDTMLKDQQVFEGVTTLMIAAGAGRMESVASLIDAGADVNAVSKNGTTALMAASAQGHLDIVKLLIENGADVNARTLETFTIGAIAVPKGTTALSEAAHGGFSDVVAFLIENGADVNAKDEDTDIDALFLAAEMGHMPVVKILVENGADVYAETKMGTALGAARHYGHPYIAAYIEEAREAVKKIQAQENEQDGN